MARQLTGTVLRIVRLFGRVRFTVRWQTGETETITVPKRRIEATIRAGDTVGTIMPDPPYTAADLMEWMTREPDDPRPPQAATWTTPPDDPRERTYHRM